MSSRIASSIARLSIVPIVLSASSRLTYARSNAACIGRTSRSASEMPSMCLPALEHAGALGGHVGVVGERVPGAEHDVVEAGERHEVLDHRRALVGALAEADRVHLGERADRAACPRRTSSTPAMSVEATAPRPTVSTPRRPVAGWMVGGGGVVTEPGYPRRRGRGPARPGPP